MLCSLKVNRVEKATIKDFLIVQKGRVKRLMKRKYKKVTPKTTKILKKYWKAYQLLEDDHYTEVHKLEVLMERETGIKGIEFFRVNGGAVVGIGDYGFYTLPLIQREELE